MRISVCSSIRSQLILLGVASASVALLCFGYGEYSSRAAALRDTGLRKLEAQAAMLGANSVAALRSHDRAAPPSSSARCVLNPAWRAPAYTIPRAASWQPTKKKNTELSPAVHPVLKRQDKSIGRWPMVQSVIDNGRRVGTICIRPEKENSYQQFREYAETCAIVLAWAFAAAFLLSCILHDPFPVPS